MVKQWDSTHGKVWVGGELWNASSQSPLIPGDEAVILAIEGLTLMVSSSEKLSDTRITWFEDNDYPKVI